MTDEAPLQHENRLSILALSVLLWFLVIIGRLTYVQVFQHARFAQMANDQQQSIIEVNAKRGTIYDRNRQELAVSVEVSSVYANPREIEPPDVPAVAAKLAEALHHDASAILRKLSTPAADGRTKAFAWIKRKVSDAEAAKVASLDLPGVYFFKEEQRFYPNNKLAAHVLGFVGMDNDGLGGLEQLYDTPLRGKPGQVAIHRDAKQNSFSTEVIQPTVSGNTLMLNISRPIQYIVENALADVMQRSRAIAGTVVVMDPHTGQILAMANEPTFDLNRYKDYNPDVWRNRAVSEAYEPGSTFKVLIAAAALEEKLTRPEEVIDCQMGSIIVRGHRFHDHKRFGALTVSDIIAKSSDVGVIKLGMRLGEEKLYQYARAFGIGRKTGVDLPGEHFGLLQPPSRWSKISIGAISFGQEVGVTPLQILQSVSAVVNGGYLVKPYVVDQIFSPEGTLVYRAKPERTPVLSPAVAEKVSEMMRGVVEHGTAKSALMVSYSAGGKTGTAQKIINRVYSHNKYIASFVGFAPVENPAMAAVVVLDEPRGKYHGGDIAAPVFKEIADRILVSLGVPQTKEPSPPKENRRHIARAARPAAKSPIRVASDAPARSLVAGPRGLYVVPTQEGAIELPDFRGKSLREISYHCALLGLKLQPVGSGLAVDQQPPAGTRVGSGSLCQVWFGTRPPQDSGASGSAKTAGAEAKQASGSLSSALSR